MRIENITVTLKDRLHRMACLLVGKGITGNIFRNGFKITVVEIHDAGKVTWVSYVHRITDRRHRRLWPEWVPFEIFRNHIVGIGRNNEVINWQPHTFRHQRSREIAKISTWHRKYDRF